MADWRSGEIVIELAATKKTITGESGAVEAYGPTNTYVFLRTFSARLRGQFRVADMAEAGSAPGYGRLPTIPGIHIAVDKKKKTVRAVDPLGFPENAGILRQINDIREPWEGTRGRAWDEHRIENATPTEIKTALVEMREIVDDKQAVVREGDLPALKEILAIEGDVKRRNIHCRHDNDGKQESEFATEAELERMGAPQESRVQIVPLKVDT